MGERGRIKYRTSTITRLEETAMVAISNSKSTTGSSEGCEGKNCTLGRGDVKKGLELTTYSLKTHTHINKMPVDVWRVRFEEKR